MLPVLRRTTAAALSCGLLVSGCLRKDYPTDGPVVADVEILGARAVDPDEILDRLSTARSPRFLGIWDGVVFEYEVYDEAILSRDLERVERFYQVRGYYNAQVTAARVIPVDAHRVRVQLRVREGEPVRVRNVFPEGTEYLPITDAAAVLEAIRLKRSAPFDEQAYEQSKRNITDTLADRGYAYATVKGRAEVDLENQTADVWFDVDAGQKATFGPIEIVGLTDIPERPVRANLGLEQGAQYSRAELEDARTALVNLGVFSSVEIRQDRSKPESRVVPITVVVQESAPRTLRLGGGARFDVLELSGHLTVGWEDKNFLGGMRKFSIEGKPGIVLFPTRMDNFTAPTHVLPKLKVRTELRQPAFIEGRTTGFIGGEFNIYPVLYPGLGDTPNENVIGFREIRTNAGAERAFFDHQLFIKPSYNWQADFPFAYIGNVETGLDRVIVSYVDLLTALDFRDDALEPTSGAYFSNSFQVAGYAFGFDADDVRLRPEVRAYLPLVPFSKKWVLAARATVGMVFPGNYGSTLQETLPANPTPAQVRDQQLLLFRAFYSGGPNSNRGYPYRGVGPHGPLSFLIPAGFDCSMNPTASQCLSPLGGLTLWEASLELRMPLFGPLRGAVFVDASDVARGIAEFRFNYPHLSPGLGLRYATPVGPIRLDVGVRVPYAQKIGSKDLPVSEGIPSDLAGVLPIAVQFGLGEAF